jgi:ferrous iron transport protein A
LNTITLDKLPLYSSCKILSLNCSGPLQRRLLDLGLTPNTPIKSIFQSPFGDPTAYEVRGFTIALRKEDANLIVCEF